MNHHRPSPPPSPPVCATFARLAPLLGTGDLDPERETWARTHLKTCAACQKRFAGYEIATAALRRHYGGVRSTVSLPTVEDLMRTADMETTDMDATTDSSQPPFMSPLPPRPPQRRRWRLATAALAAAMVLAVIGTLFALRGQSPFQGPGAGKTPHTTPSGKVLEFPVDLKDKTPTAIAVDKDGNPWTLSPQNDAIEYQYLEDPTEGWPPYADMVWAPSDAASHTETGNSGLTGLAIAPDGSVWFTEANANRIGRIIPKPLFVATTPSGSLNNFPGGAITDFKSVNTDGRPLAIAAGSNGDVWFTESNTHPGRASFIGEIHSDGTFGKFFLALPYDAGLVSITRAPDGSMWFVEAKTGHIDRFDPAIFTGDLAKMQNASKRYALPNPKSEPVAIAAGADGSIWFAERGANAIGRMSPSGKVTEFPVPTANSGLANLAVAADGSVWFTESKANKLGHLNPTSGAIKELAIPTASAQPNGIAIAPDGKVWFTETASGKIGYVTP